MRERIKRVMKTVFGLDGDVPDDISPGTCDKWDSMNHVQLVISLEAEFNVSFEPEDIAEMKTLDEIERKIGLLK